MREAVINRCGEVLDGTKSKGAVADQFDLVVHAFEGAIGDPKPGPSQDAIEMSSQPPDHALEGLQPRAHRRMHPALQMLFGAGRLTVAPEELESFFEIVSPDDGRIPTHQGGERLAFAGTQAPGVLQQQEASSLKDGLLLPHQALHFAAPDLIHGPVEVLHEGKAVEEDLSLGSIVPNGVQIRLPHVEADGADRDGAARAQPREKVGQSFLGPILAHPKQDTALQVIDGGEVVMPFAATHFINPPNAQRLATTPSQATTLPTIEATHFQSSWI